MAVIRDSTHVKTVIGGRNTMERNSAHDLEQRIVENAVPLAIDFLSKFGEFSPFGIGLQKNGSFEMFGATGDSDTLLPPPQAMQMLRATMRQARDRLDGYGAVYNGVREGKDVVVVEIETRSPSAVHVVFEYESSRLPSGTFDVSLKSGRHRALEPTGFVGA